MFTSNLMRPEPTAGDNSATRTNGRAPTIKSRLSNRTPKSLLRTLTPYTKTPTSTRATSYNPWTAVLSCSLHAIPLP